MWLFLPEGMVSVVADRRDPERGPLLVRARTREHLEAFLDLIREAIGGRPGLASMETPEADYRWRCWCERDEVREAAALAIQRLSWTNFKAAIPDPEYHDAASEVWASMGALQWRQEEQAGTLDPSMRYPLNSWADEREKRAQISAVAMAQAEKQRQAEEDAAWGQWYAEQGAGR